MAKELSLATEQTHPFILTPASTGGETNENTSSVWFKNVLKNSPVLNK